MTPEMIVAAGGIITALALLLRTLSDGAKTRAEVRRIMHELTPNSGLSARDAIDRADKGTKANTHTSALHHAEILARLDALAAIDEADQARAREVHQRMWTAINRKKRRR